MKAFCTKGTRNGAGASRPAQRATRYERLEKWTSGRGWQPGRILVLDAGLAAGGQVGEYKCGAQEYQGWAGRSQEINYTFTTTQVWKRP